jgi:hypothetical protein
MGHASGELVLGGRLVQARRPRARTLDGREVVLPSWKFGARLMWMRLLVAVTMRLPTSYAVRVNGAVSA